jgi:hypothetical protein
MGKRLILRGEYTALIFCCQCSESTGDLLTSAASGLRLRKTPTRKTSFELAGGAPGLRAGARKRLLTSSIPRYWVAELSHKNIA